jgi:acyl-coenzyme A synthetase/AMP-(fatty) acid ligase
VKVRGFRVELDAVARVLEQAPGCLQAVVALLGDGTLGAVVTPADLDPALAAAVVAEHLPYYCVPSVVRAVAELPATARGKVDRDAARRLLEPLRATA